MNILIKFKDLLIETLKDNKKLIIGLYIVFIISFVAAWLLSGNMIESYLSNLPNSNNPTNITDTNAIDLFVHNEVGGILIYFASVFFAIPTIVMLLYNAVNLGILGQLFSQVIPNGGIQFIIYLIPHGIFEITATVLQSVAGILLFLFLWRLLKAWISKETEGFSDAFGKTKKILIQSVILMIFSTILLLIAAPIEAYFSVPFSEFVVGI